VNGTDTPEFKEEDGLIWSGKRVFEFECERNVADGVVVRTLVRDGTVALISGWVAEEGSEGRLLKAALLNGEIEGVDEIAVVG
jgi:hypothetical protein